VSCLGELKSLSEAAGYRIAETLEIIASPKSKYYIGSGKVKELANMVSELEVEKIIFGNELKVVQIYNLAKITKVEVIDRFQLILEIFNQRASTKEAKLQIRLAQLRRELTHAKEKVRLSKISEQPGFLGLGKYEVDVYHESIRRQLYSIQNKLKEIKKTREIHRQRRRNLGYPLVSLAGYTNSGKSTLFNSLTLGNIPADPRLFTTLSTTTRSISLFKENIMLTDTVGFVDKLPMTLIEAFNSTLEETTFSDLILLVVDASESVNEIERKISCCFETIHEIGATGISILIVLNKIDLIRREALEQKIEKIEKIEINSLDIVSISALYKINLNLLKEKIADILITYIQSFFIMPINEESLSFLSWIFDHANVVNVSYDEKGLNVSLKAAPQIVDKIKSMVEKLGGIWE
jgi:GTP-binding protein HflX